MMIAVTELRARPEDPRGTSLLLGRHWYGWVLLVTASAAVGGLAWFALAANEPQPQRFCTDIGLMTPTSGSTPDDAMSAWVTSQGGDPADWAAGSERMEHIYHPRTAAAEPQGYVEIAVREISPGVWRVGGACAN
jgi:hypothetical protein